VQIHEELPARYCFILDIEDIRAIQHQAMLDVKSRKIHVVIDEVEELSLSIQIVLEKMDHDAVFGHSLGKGRHIGFIGYGGDLALFFQVKLWTLQIFHRLGAGDQACGSKALILFVKLEAIVHPDEDKELDHYSDQDGTQYDVTRVMELPEDIHHDEEDQYSHGIALEHPPDQL